MNSFRQHVPQKSPRRIDLSSRFRAPSQRIKHKPNLLLARQIRAHGRDTIVRKATHAAFLQRDPLQWTLAGDVGGLASMAVVDLFA